MKEFFKTIAEKKITLPANVLSLLTNCKSFEVYNTSKQLVTASVGGEQNNSYEVKYDVPGKGEVLEAIVHRVRNGISANYLEPYMRRRDPDTMAIADDLPTDKERYRDKYGYEFDSVMEETFDWLKEQELAVFFYFAGSGKIGSGGMAIVPGNAGFFALGLSMLQRIIPVYDLDEQFAIESVIYVAPVFRHTHFKGKQVVVHDCISGETHPGKP